jgi:hypothetical protein
MRWFWSVAVLSSLIPVGLILYALSVVEKDALRPAALVTASVLALVSDVGLWLLALIIWITRIYRSSGSAGRRFADPSY